MRELGFVTLALVAVLGCTDSDDGTDVPVPDTPAPPSAGALSVREAAKVVRFDERTQQYYYQVSTVLKDANGKVLWSGEMYAEWSAIAKGGIVYPRQPAQLRTAAKPPWKDV